MENLLCEYPSLQQEAANPNTSGKRLQELASVSTDLARLVAKNPCATPKLLGELGASRDTVTRSHVAANPNTPTEVLLKLGSEFPKQLLGNPALALLLLENPNLVNEMPRTTVRSLLKLEELPAFVLEKLAHARHRWVRCTIAQNPNTPAWVLQELAQDMDVEIRQYAVQHPNNCVRLRGGFAIPLRKAQLAKKQEVEVCFMHRDTI